MDTSHTFVAALTLLACGAARAELVFNQPTHPNAANVGLGYFSHSAPKPTRNFLHADNFTLATSAQVNRIVWWGLSEGIEHTDLSNFSSFTIKLYSTRLSLGQPIPNQTLATHVFAIGDTSPTPTGRAAPANGALEYRHEVTLPVPFTLDAGTQYFISIGAGFISGTSDAWMWQDSNTTEKKSGVYSYATARWSSFIDTDTAMELHTVPAPGALGLAVALVPALVRRRRRHWRA